MSEQNPEPRLAVYQFTREEAIAFAQNREWEFLTPAERGLLQLRQEKLCMDFSAFHEGVTVLLGRPVYTHEFANPDLLWDELHGRAEKPDLAGIIAKLPVHLRGGVVIVERGEA